MEMQQVEVHVVNMKASSSGHPLDLSPSSSDASSATLNSFFQSSPDHSSSTFPSLPLIPCAPRPLQAADQSSQITIAIPSSGPPRLHRTREWVLKSLKESTLHAITLRNLKKSDRAYQKEASSYKKAVRRISDELYFIVSLYALLQGVLFAAVAQSSIFTCSDVWGPVGIVGFVTIGTIIGARDKLRRMREQKRQVKISQRRQDTVYDKIELLLSKGSACSLEELEPQHTYKFDAAPGIWGSFYGFLVMGFLVGFSALIMAACIRMLCQPCRCQS